MITRERQVSGGLGRAAAELRRKFALVIRNVDARRAFIRMQDRQETERSYHSTQQD